MAYTLMAYNLMEYTLMAYFDQMQYSNVQTNRYITFVMNVDGILSKCLPGERPLRALNTIYKKHQYNILFTLIGHQYNVLFTLMGHQYNVLAVLLCSVATANMGKI